jgi:hypothetical protein
MLAGWLEDSVQADWLAGSMLAGLLTGSMQTGWLVGRCRLAGRFFTGWLADSESLANWLTSRFFILFDAGWLAGSI